VVPRHTAGNAFPRIAVREGCVVGFNYDQLNTSVDACWIVGCRGTGEVRSGHDVIAVWQEVSVSDGGGAVEAACAVGAGA